VEQQKTVDAFYDALKAECASVRNGTTLVRGVRCAEVCVGAVRDAGV
jgi:hypothetical protein